MFVLLGHKPVGRLNRLVATHLPQGVSGLPDQARYLAVVALGYTELPNLLLQSCGIFANSTADRYHVFALATPETCTNPHDGQHTLMAPCSVPATSSGWLLAKANDTAMASKQ
jgi:hypothetical protein